SRVAQTPLERWNDMARQQNRFRVLRNEALIVRTSIWERCSLLSCDGESPRIDSLKRRTTLSTFSLIQASVSHFCRICFILPCVCRLNFIRVVVDATEPSERESEIVKVVNILL